MNYKGYGYDLVDKMKNQGCTYQEIVNYLCEMYDSALDIIHVMLKQETIQVEDSAYVDKYLSIGNKEEDEDGTV